MFQDNCLHPCISCIDDGHPLRPAQPHSGDRESWVFTACPASYLSIQTSTPSARELLTCLTLLRPAQTEAQTPEWMSETIHPITCTSLQTLFPSYLAVVIPTWFLLRCCTAYKIFTMLCTPDLAHNNTFQPQEYIFSNVPHNISQISFYLFIINRMVHWTNIELDSHSTLLFIAATILNATLLKCT